MKLDKKLARISRIRDPTLRFRKLNGLSLSYIRQRKQIEKTLSKINKLKGVR